MRSVLLSIAFILIVSVSLLGQTWTVTTNQSFSGSNFTYTDIIIKNNATLNLTNCNITINYQGNIMVEAGGKLILNSCFVGVNASGQNPDYWNGIEVIGTPTTAQTKSNQGSLVLKNTIVQDAIVGISVGKRKYEIDDVVKTNWFQNGGGIVKGVNSSIINCRYAMIFSPYYDPALLTHPTANKSSFTGCTFVWDGNANRDLCGKLINNGDIVILNTLVELNQVHDVLFEGCNFKSTRTFSNWFLNNNPLQDFNFGYDINGSCRGVGLKSLGASFHINRSIPCSNTSSSPLGSDGCTDCTGDRTTFEGLGVGLYIDGFKNNDINYPNYPTTNLEPQHEIVGANFYNNRVAIVGYAMQYFVNSAVPIVDQPNNPLKNIFINRCVFKLDDLWYNYHYMWEGDFIILENCGDVEVSDNTFNMTMTTLATKPVQPRPYFRMCWDGAYTYTRFTSCNSGNVSLRRNSYYLSRFKEEPCVRSYAFNSFRGLNSNLSATCNSYSSAAGMDFRYNQVNSCFCYLSDWVIGNKGDVSFPVQGSNVLDAGNMWNNIPNSPQTNGYAYNMNIDLDPSDQSIEYFYDNSNSYKNPVTNRDPNSKIIKTAIGNINSCNASEYCKYYKARRFLDEDGTGPNPTALHHDFPEVSFNVTPVVGTSIATIVLSPVYFVALNGVITITKEDGSVIHTEVVNNGSVVQPFSFNFDFSSYPSGTYYIKFVDSLGRVYVIVFIKP